MSLSDIDIGTRYRHPETDIHNVDICFGYCRYRVPFRTLTVPDTVTVTDTGIQFWYLNGRTLRVGYSALWGLPYIGPTMGLKGEGDPRVVDVS